MLCPNTERKYRRKISVADALCPGKKSYKLMLERGNDDAVIFFSHGIFFPLVNNYEGREEIWTLLPQTGRLTGPRLPAQDQPAASSLGHEWLAAVFWFF